MRKAKLRKLLIRKVKELDEQYREISPFFHDERIHSFRTDTKQLKAFLRLVNKTSARHPLSLPEGFKRAYHLSGEIREIQLLRKTILNKWKAPLPVLYERLGQSLIRLQKAWDTAYRLELLSKLKKDWRRVRMEGLRRGPFRNWFEKNLSKVSSLGLTPTDEELHGARRKLKEMLYNLRLAKKEWRGGYEALRDLPLTQLETLADRLGVYHDHLMIYRCLSSFNPPDLEQTERDALDELCRNEWVFITLEKEKLPGELKAVFGK